MLQLNLVVVQQSPKERMGRNHESALMEGRKGHDVAIGRRQCILMTGHEPLHHVGPPIEKIVLDEALHACVSDVRAVPGLHGKAKTEEQGLFGGGGEVKGMDLGH